MYTKSFESPVSSMSEDLLDRWRLAKDVYTTVRETPPDWSCRVGIYGKWGEGKTSLLRFVETQAQEDALISFWINPSQPGKAQFFEVLETSTQSEAVRRNASELLDSLSWSHPREGFGGNRDEFRQILLLPGVAAALWAAATSQRVNYRFQQRLIEVRKGVIRAGIAEGQLPIPNWLAERIKELGAPELASGADLET